ncbi:MAG TPA: amidohydrolase family protein [Solirubrobacterales bacterium]|nr:amidohydrolase family protein [Solirubrobacterales bacterium]
MTGELGEIIASTRWTDTHEHLIEERHRLEAPYTFTECASGTTVVIPDDWSALVYDYAICDLLSAGMPKRDVDRFWSPQLDGLEKWDLVAPYWRDTRATGYHRALDLTTEILCGSRLSRETCCEIDKQLRELRRPGYFHDLINVSAGVQSSQVHSLDHDPFCETEYPDLLLQDLSLVPLIMGHHASVETASGIEVTTLDDYVAVIERCFAQYAPRAVAVKCLWAYLRPLHTEVPAQPPREAFALLRAGRADDTHTREVQDYLFDVCIRLATEWRLPVKMHLGTLDGNRNPMLVHVPDHPRAAIALAQRYADTRFVFMHMAWPFQEGMIAVAKHFPNAWVDLCWSWILAPEATRAFVVRFLTAAPSNKLLCFGGDYAIAENIVGHAALARAGLCGALEDLIESGWLTLEQACEVAPRLMSGNAEQLFFGR